MTSGAEVPGLGWHIVSGEDLLKMLRRVQTGEEPDLVFAEAWANSDELPRPDDPVHDD